MVKFRAKSVMSVEELDAIEIKHENGWVIGNLLDGKWIVGEVVDVDQDYIQPAFWVPVEQNTIEQLGKDTELQKVYDEISESHGLHLSTVKELQRIVTMVSGIDYEDRRVGVALVELEEKFHQHMDKWVEGKSFNELTNKYGYTKGSLIYLGMDENEVVAMSDEDAEGALEACSSFV